MLALDLLGDVLGRRVRDLVAEHRREPGIVLGQRQDAGVDDDLPARQAVGVGNILADAASPSRRSPACRAPPTASMRFATRCTRRTAAGRHDPRTVLAQRLGVILTAELHLLRVGELDVLHAVRDRCLLPVCVSRRTPTTTAAITIATRGRPMRNASTAFAALIWVEYGRADAPPAGSPNRCGAPAVAWRELRQAVRRSAGGASPMPRGRRSR